MTPARVDELWSAAVTRVHAHGGVALVEFAALVRDEVRRQTLEEAARLCESRPYVRLWGRQCAQAIRWEAGER